MRIVTKLLCVAAILCLPIEGRAQDHAELASNAFARSDYDGARRYLRLAMGRAKDADERTAVRRKIAVTYVFQGDLESARKEYRNTIDTAREAGKPDAHDHFALAAISALEKDAAAVEKHIADASGVQPQTPYAPMFHAIVWGHLQDVERVAQARAAMDAKAAALPKDSMAQQAAALARAIHATLVGDQKTASAAAALIKAPSMRAFANVFTANALRRSGKKTEAARTDARVRSFKELSIYSAVAWRMIK